VDGAPYYHGAALEDASYPWTLIDTFSIIGNVKQQSTIDFETVSDQYSKFKIEVDCTFSGTAVSSSDPLLITANNVVLFQTSAPVGSYYYSFNSLGLEFEIYKVMASSGLSYRAYPYPTSNVDTMMFTVRIQDNQNASGQATVRIYAK
jgi:hypothetical protein